MNITFEWLKSESGDAWLRNAPHEEIEAALVSASGAIDPFDWEASQARAILGLACRGEFIRPPDLDPEDDRMPIPWVVRGIVRELVFEKTCNDWSYPAVDEWCVAHGFSTGSRCAGCPTGLKRGKWQIAKFNNLNDDDILKLDGIIESVGALAHVVRLFRVQEQIEVVLVRGSDLVIRPPPPASPDALKSRARWCTDAPRHSGAPVTARGDFEHRRAAARRQSSYRRRRRLGQITVAVVVSVPDLTAAALRRGLLGSAGATREELAKVCEAIIQDALK
jgi:hypothetical protein